MYTCWCFNIINTHILVAYLCISTEDKVTFNKKKKPCYTSKCIPIHMWWFVTRVGHCRISGYPARKSRISGNIRQGMTDNPESGKKNQIRSNPRKDVIFSTSFELRFCLNSKYCRTFLLNMIFWSSLIMQNKGCIGVLPSNFGIWKPTKLSISVTIG